MNNETENLSREDEKVALLLKSLKKIDAPADFDFRLMLKIEAAKEKRSGFSFWKPLLVGVPAMACAAIIGLVLLQWDARLEDSADRLSANSMEAVKPPAIEGQPLAAIPDDSAKDIAPEIPEKADSGSNPVRPDSPAAPEDYEVASAPSDDEKDAEIDSPGPGAPASAKTKNKGKKKKLNGDFNGSKLLAGTDEEPLKIKPLNPPEDITGGISPAEISASAEKRLVDFGVVINGNREVIRVKENSAAAKAGIKEKDVLTKVSDSKIDPKKDRNKPSMSVDIIRGKETLKVSIKP